MTPRLIINRFHAGEVASYVRIGSICIVWRWKITFLPKARAGTRELWPSFTLIFVQIVHANNWKWPQKQHITRWGKIPSTFLSFFPKLSTGPLIMFVLIKWCWRPIFLIIVTIICRKLELLLFTLNRWDAASWGLRCTHINYLRMNVMKNTTSRVLQWGRTWDAVTPVVGKKTLGVMLSFTCSLTVFVFRRSSSSAVVFLQPLEQMPSGKSLWLSELPMCNLFFLYCL